MEEFNVEIPSSFIIEVEKALNLREVHDEPMEVSFHEEGVKIPIANYFFNFGNCSYEIYNTSVADAPKYVVKKFFISDSGFALWIN
jgi:hypothetical protein